MFLLLLNSVGQLLNSRQVGAEDLYPIANITTAQMAELTKDANFKAQESELV